MLLAKVIHPVIIENHGVKFQVSAHCRISLSQAKKIVLLYLRTHKIKKKDLGTTVTIFTNYDAESIALLGP
jgi:hypothetical protein